MYGSGADGPFDVGSERGQTMKHAKLTGAQVIWVLATVQIVLIIWLRISPAIRATGQDAWMTMILAVLFSIPLALLVVLLCAKHPNETLVGFSEKLLGKWLGKMITIPYLLLWIALPAGGLRLFGDFIHLFLLDETPVWLIMLFMVCLMTYITYTGGISGIGRFCEIAGPIAILTLIASFVLNIGSLKGTNLLPVYAYSGALRMLKESVSPGSFMAEATVLLAVLPFLKQPRQAYSRTLIGVGVTGVMTVIATAIVLLVFGPDVAAKLKFSYFMLVRYINILDFIQNMDIFVIFIWIFGLLARLSLFLFISSYETAQWLRIRGWRRLIWVGAATIYATAVFIPNESYFTITDEKWPVFVFPVVGVAIPALLLMVSMVKQRASS